MEKEINDSDNKGSDLRPRSIQELRYRFRIPSYQRGYRWERQNVEQLLNDIVESDKDAPYYLQPIVVSPAPDGVKMLSDGERYDYDLIDGQQRLTTIFLILQALKKKQADSCKAKALLESMNVPYTPNFLDNIEIVIPFELAYETRKSTLSFLNGIASIEVGKDGLPVSREDIISICQSPDHLYMWHAYNTISNWLGKTDSIAKLTRALTDIKPYKNQVKVIWYELPDTITDWKKFTDLNIGKIPLTNSELVKALFLRTKNFSGEKDSEAEEYEKQTLVAQWDQIERELSEQDFWGFLTRADASAYPTKIDLLFDLISDKANSGSNDKLFTFNYFVDWFDRHTEMTGKQKWDEIFLQYQRLRDWWKDREIYHRLGYLVAIDFPHNALSKVFRFAHPAFPGRKNRGTDRVREVLNYLVRRSLLIPKGGKFEDVTSFHDLKYNASDNPDPAKPDRAHHEMIKRYLTLYNIMVTEDAGKDLRYPFGLHNNVGGGWSLEHIHAQKSETLNKGWQWDEWICNHKITVGKILTAYKDNEEIIALANNLFNLMCRFTIDDKREAFNDIADKFAELIESLPGAKGLYQDDIGNLALLSKNDNSTLNNSTFDVKRRKVIEMLSTNFVPIATERVFLKAISGVTEVPDSEGKVVAMPYSCDTEHLFFWGDSDRQAYLKDMDVKLAKFL